MLIQQAKAQDLEAGFQSDAPKIFQTAVSPSEPSQPNVPIILAGGLGAGLVLGTIAALLCSFSTGRIYTRSAILDLVDPQLSVPGAKLRVLRGTAYQMLADRAAKLRSEQLTELPVLVNAAPTKWVMLSSEGTRRGPLGLAIWLAQRCTRGTKRNAVLDMTGTIRLPAQSLDTPCPRVLTAIRMRSWWFFALPNRNRPASC